MATSKPLNYARSKKMFTNKAEIYTLPDSNTSIRIRLIIKLISITLNGRINSSSRGTTTKSKNLQLIPIVEMAGRIRLGTQIKVTTSLKTNTIRGSNRTMDRKLIIKTHTRTIKAGSSRTPIIRTSSRRITCPQIRPITSTLSNRECQQIFRNQNMRTLQALITLPLTKSLARNQRKNRSSLRQLTWTTCSDINSPCLRSKDLTTKFLKNCSIACRRLRLVGQLRNSVCLKTTKFLRGSKPIAHTVQSSIFSSRLQSAKTMDISRTNPLSSLKILLLMCSPTLLITILASQAARRKTKGNKTPSQIHLLTQTKAKQIR